MQQGAGMCLDPPDRFATTMRLCFAWLTDEQIIEGVRYLKEQGTPMVPKADDWKEREREEREEREYQGTDIS